ncbi:DUF4142 domain-containing protein [Arundinibacter roseus]|uniref:DUF4142 domain-containing protein n=1 Tax=Arundinibacter roseus TaxID=2070510 RepID=A0A4R4KR39_9BACT|nr:DUF4142 domain-containing protein [Arundinibacter roseus]TDB68871.1 DUF4142 domain-containing protein [Arundinibacter roseus]
MKKLKWNLLLLAGMFVAVSCKDDDNDDMMVSEVDREFAMAAAETNLMGVRTGQLVATNAESQDVKDYGVSMSEYYNMATTDLGTLAQQSAITLPTTLGTMNQEAYTQLSGLQGARFDSAYIDWAVRSNQQSIATLKSHRDSTTSAAFRSWVDARINTLEENHETAMSIQESMMVNTGN